LDGDTSNATGKNHLGTAEGVKYASLPEKISRAVSKFSDLSDAEKASLKTDVLSALNLKGEAPITKLLPILRQGEGKVYRKAIQKVLSSAKPEAGDQTGVHLPLDSVFIPKERRLEIFIPENLETHADSVILQELMRFYSEVQGVKLSRTPGEMTTPEEKGNFFLMGYVTELLSNQKIERITYNKDSSYQNGRMCARVKLILGSINPSMTPTKYIRIPARYLGGTEQFKESEFIRSLRTYIAAKDVDLVAKLLNNLAGLILTTRSDEVKAKLGNSLLMPHSEFLHVFKRKTTRSDNSKKGKPKVTLVTIDPTKPSQLATVAPWERDAVAEMFEYPWLQEKRLIEEYDNTPGFNRNYKELSNRVVKIFEEQWKSKQKVLRLTKHRLGGYPIKDDPLFKKLNWMRETLTKWASLDEVPDAARPDFNPWTTYGAEKVSDHEGYVSSLHVLFERGELERTLPQMEKLFSAWEERRGVLADPVGSENADT